MRLEYPSHVCEHVFTSRTGLHCHFSTRGFWRKAGPSSVFRDFCAKILSSNATHLQNGNIETRKNNNVISRRIVFLTSYFRFAPHSVTVTTRVITFFWNPLFATGILGWGVDPTYDIYYPYCRWKKSQTTTWGTEKKNLSIMGENKLPFPQLVILPDFWTNQLRIIN